MLKTFSFPLITCMRECSLFCFLFSHCSNKSSCALYFSHTDLFILSNNISGLFFGCRFLLDFCMPELHTFSGLHIAGRSYSQCCLRSANHSTESRSDLRVQTGKHWHEVQPERSCSGYTMTCKSFAKCFDISVISTNTCDILMLQCHQKFFMFLLFVCSIICWILKITNIRALYINSVWNNWL